MARSWLEGLLRVFPSNEVDPADFRAVPSDGVPPPFRKLIDHHHHMTVTLEEHYGVPMHLNVIEIHHSGNDYARRLTLSAGPDGPIVLAGVMRFNLEHCQESLRREIVDADAPLGRILVEHGVMRRLQTVAFLEVPVTSSFCKLFKIDDPSNAASPNAYGRLAMIFCDEQPAVELLEVVAPTV